jgi:hypothetical protein
LRQLPSLLERTLVRCLAATVFEAVGADWTSLAESQTLYDRLDVHATVTRVVDFNVGAAG